MSMALIWKCHYVRNAETDADKASMKDYLAVAGYLNASFYTKKKWIRWVSSVLSTSVLFQRFWFRDWSSRPILKRIKEASKNYKGATPWQLKKCGMPMYKSILYRRWDRLGEKPISWQICSKRWKTAPHHYMIFMQLINPPPATRRDLDVIYVQDQAVWVLKLQRFPFFSLPYHVSRPCLQGRWGW